MTFSAAAALFLPMAAIAAPAAATPESPQAAVEALLAADRDFSRQAAARSPADGIAAMLDAGVIMPTREGLTSGREAVIASMRANPNFQGEGATWRPVRGGISGDGQHGFTFGYLDISGAPEGRPAGRRYLAYWVKRPEGWRVAAYRHAVRGPEDRGVEPMAPALPARMVAAESRGAEEHSRTLSAAEQAFSDRAQQVGLRAAFTEYGSADAINLGGPAGFVVGNEAIGQALFPDQTASPVHWKADRVLVAPSGDMGITFGFVRLHAAPPEGQPGAFPFFTIWRRDSAGQSWRYVAE